MTKQDLLDEISTKIDLITSGAEVTQAEVAEIDNLFKSALQKENRDFDVFRSLVGLFSIFVTNEQWMFALHPLVVSNVLQIVHLLKQYEGFSLGAFDARVRIRDEILKKQADLHCSCSCQHILRLSAGDLVAVESIYAPDGDVVNDIEFWKNPPNTVLSPDDLNVAVTVNRREILVFLGTEKVCQRFPSELNLSNTYEVSKWLISSTNKIAYSKLSKFQVTKNLRKIKNA